MAITGKAAEDILERIFQPTTKPSARDQAEETLRHPKRLVYVAMSNKSFYWRAHIQKFVLDSGRELGLVRGEHDVVRHRLDVDASVPGRRIGELAQRRHRVRAVPHAIQR